MARVSVVYYTANQETAEFDATTRRALRDVIGGLPLVSVSQEPLEGFGLNVCVGKVGRSYQNLYRQMLIGCQHAETEFVSLAESDCLYPPGYFQTEPLAEAQCCADLWILRHQDPGQFAFKGPSDGLLLVERELLIGKLEERLQGLNEWGPAKVKCPFRPGEVALFPTLPVVSVKTGRSLNPILAPSHKRSSLPHWGEAADWSRTLGLVEEGA